MAKDRAKYQFLDSSRAWSFMRACDDSGIPAGFPTLKAPYTVQVYLETWIERDRCDAFAADRDGSIVDYELGGVSSCLE